jgi:hypothetical protein
MIKTEVITKTEVSTKTEEMKTEREKGQVLVGWRRFGTKLSKTFKLTKKTKKKLFFVENNKSVKIIFFSDEKV